jgi:hypothetical protein
MTHVALFIVVGLFVVAAIAVITLAARRRQPRVFATEYSRIVEEAGGGEAPVLRRFPVRPLSASDRGSLSTAWRAILASFPDNPRRAVKRADAIIAEAMSLRGYPMGDFDQRAADIAHDHPEVVQHFRLAHSVAREDGAEPEVLDQAMASFRILFDALVGDGQRIANRTAAASLAAARIARAETKTPETH